MKKLDGMCSSKVLQKEDYQVIVTVVGVQHLHGIDMEKYTDLWSRRDARTGSHEKGPMCHACILIACTVDAQTMHRTRRMYSKK